MGMRGEQVKRGGGKIIAMFSMGAVTRPGSWSVVQGAIILVYTL